MIEITIPKLGLTMENAKLAEWKFRSGDEVKSGETVLVIETDKVSYEVPAPEDGILHPVVPKGKICAVEETVGYLARDREEYERVIREHPPQEAEGAETAEAEAEPGPRPEDRTVPPPAGQTNGRIKASPLARSMAGAHGLVLSTLRGTGPGGRIVRADILQALEIREATPAGAVEPMWGKEAMESLPIQGVRRVIFDNMVQSLSRSAQLTLHTEASAESLKALRQRLGTEEHKVSYNAILVKVSAMALRLHPRINATVDGDTVRVWRQIHIGLAMEAEDALIVPVIRNPDSKTIREIDRDIAELADRVRGNRFSPDDLANGTFTISNLGFGDIDHFTPIIRPPESAILGVGRIIKKPWVRDDRIVPETRMGLSLTFDHRIIDGAPGARFLKTVKDMIEDPLLLIG